MRASDGTARNLLTFSIYEKGGADGYGDTYLGDIESTDSITAEHRWAKTHGLDYRERRALKAREKPEPETLDEEIARYRDLDAKGDALDEAADHDEGVDE